MYMWRKIKAFGWMFAFWPKSGWEDLNNLKTFTATCSTVLNVWFYWIHVNVVIKSSNLQDQVRTFTWCYLRFVFHTCQSCVLVSCHLVSESDCTIDNHNDNFEMSPVLFSIKVRSCLLCFIFDTLIVPSRYCYKIVWHLLLRWRYFSGDKTFSPQARDIAPLKIRNQFILSSQFVLFWLENKHFNIQNTVISTKIWL